MELPDTEPGSPARMMTLRRSKAGLFAGIALTLLSASCRKGEQNLRSTSSDTPVILISVDTLRSDRLPAYGYDTISTPRLSALAGDSVVFERAFAHVPLTLPSHASILTGLLPTIHGVRDNLGYRLDGSAHPTLPRLLKERGYATGAAVSSWVLRAETGLGAEFDHYDDVMNEGATLLSSSERPGEETVSSALSWIESNRQTPFFFMLHLFEPHAPYAAPGADPALSPYDAEIVLTDELVGRFLTRLKELDLYDRALIIFLSDHGEGLGEHGEPQHGIFLYREALQVPLFIKLPQSERRGERVATPAGLIDLVPTVSALLGLDPGEVEGRNLFEKHEQSQPIYAESHYGRIHLGWSPLRSLIGDPLQYIEAPRPELYDLAADPGSLENILDSERRSAARLREELAKIPAGAESTAPVSAEESARLAALGYLGGTAAAGEDLPDPKDRIGEIALLARAGELQSEGKSGEAIRVYRELLAENPRLVDGWTRLAGLLETAGSADEAIEAYRRAAELSPSLAPELALSTASILVREGRHEEAESHARAGLSSDPDSARLLMARIQMARRNPAAAERELRAMSGSGSQPQAQILLAEIRDQQGRSSEALELLDSASKSAESPIERLEFMRAHILTRMGRHGEAIQAFQREIAAFPHHRQAYGYLAVVLFMNGRADQGHAALEQMHRANPDAASRELAIRTLEGIGDSAGAARWRARSR